MSHDRDGRAKNLQERPPMPLFKKNKFKVELLSIDEKSVLTIRIVDENDLDTTEKLEDVMKSMMSKRRMSPPYEEIKENDYFLALVGSKIIRIQVLEKSGIESPISCVDIDTNDPVQVYFYNVIVIRASALKFPRKVIQCELHELELLKGTNAVQLAFGDMQFPHEYLCTIYNKRVDFPLVGLSEVHNPSNNTVLEMVRKQIPQICKLQYPTELTPMSITHVEDNGRISLHPQRNVLLYNIEKFLETFNVENYHVKEATLTTKTLERCKDPDMIYIAKYDGVYTRVQIIEDSFPKDKVLVEYIDYGNLGELAMSELIHIHHVEKTLSIIPYQCLHVKLPKIGYIENLDAVWAINDTLFISATVDEESGLPQISFMKSNGLNGNSLESVEDFLLKINAGYFSKPEPKPLAKQKRSIPPPDELTPPSTDHWSTEVNTGDPVDYPQRAQDVTEVKTPHKKETKMDSRSKEIIKNKGSSCPVPLSPPLINPNDWIMNINSVQLFRITQFNSFQDFSVQLYSSKDELLHLEKELGEFCNGDSKLPVTQETFNAVNNNNIFAYHHPIMGRWIRVLLLSQSKGVMSTCVTLTLRTLDYGFVVTRSFTKKEDWKCLQFLDPYFCKMIAKGLSCSTFVDRRLPSGSGIPSQDIKNWLVKGYVHDIRVSADDICTLILTPIETFADFKKIDKVDENPVLTRRSSI